MCGMRIPVPGPSLNECFPNAGQTEVVFANELLGACFCGVVGAVETDIGSLSDPRPEHLAESRGTQIASAGGPTKS